MKIVVQKVYLDIFSKAKSKHSCADNWHNSCCLVCMFKLGLWHVPVWEDPYLSQTDSSCNPVLIHVFSSELFLSLLVFKKVITWHFRVLTTGGKKQDWSNFSYTKGILDIGMLIYI